ncbi:LacI family DNA-binding transcriptional regulator [Microbacterium sp. NPDC055683]
MASQRSVTMADVAARAGVSRSLVSLVVRGSPLVSDTRRAAVTAAIDELGYRHNQIASRLAAKSTRTLGLLLFDLHNPAYADLHDGVVEVAEAAGYEVLLVAGSRDGAREQAVLERLVTLQVDGLMVAGYVGSAADLLRTARGLPVVVANRRIDADGVDSVVSDDAEGATIAVEHLIALGHRRIAHVSSPHGNPYQLRRRGYEAAMRAHGLEPWVVEGDLAATGGRAAVAAWGEGEALPTAVFAHNDLSAVGAMSALAERGIGVPGDVSLVGYDNTDLSALPSIGLTTLEQHAREQGRMAVRMLLERVAEPGIAARAVVIPPVLVERSTTAPPRGATRRGGLDAEPLGAL